LVVNDTVFYEVSDCRLPPPVAELKISDSRFNIEKQGLRINGLGIMGVEVLGC